MLSGCQVNFEKRQPPQPRVRLLGVHVDLSTSSAVASATAARRSKLATITKRFLEVTTLSPTDVGSLAGKAMFFMSSFVGGPWPSRGQAPLCPTACAQSQHPTHSRTHRISLAYSPLGPYRAPARHFLPPLRSLMPTPIFAAGDTQYKVSDMVEDKVVHFGRYHEVGQRHCGFHDP